MPVRRRGVGERDTMCRSDVEPGAIDVLDDIAQAAPVGSRWASRAHDVGAGEALVADLGPDVERLEERVEFVAGEFNAWS